MKKLESITTALAVLLGAVSAHAQGTAKAAESNPAPTVAQSKPVQPPPDLLSHGLDSRPARADERIRIFTYRPDAIIHLRGAYGYALAVEFGANERIQTVSMGDTVAWQAVAKENTLFLKPHEDKPETNMLVQTTKRAYTFALSAFHASGAGDARLTYRVRFRFPDEEERELQAQLSAQNEAAAREARLVVGAQTANARGMPPGVASAGRSKTPAEWNFNYSFKGSRLAAPIQVLDDGEFTYVRFPNHESVPAMFVVDSQGNETLANFRREGEWMVLEKLARQIVFRMNNNTEIACVFNDSFPQRSDSTLRERR